MAAKRVVLFIQGTGDMWEEEGSGVLVKYLEKSLGSDYTVIAPQMPGAATEPHYVPWRDRVESELRKLHGPVGLVGHSFGGSVLLKYLAEGPAPRSISGLFLVSTPFWNSEGWESEYALPADFSASRLDMPVFIYHSREDPHVPFDHLERYEELLPGAVSRPIDGSEHSFMNGLPALVVDIRGIAA